MNYLRISWIFVFMLIFTAANSQTILSVSPAQGNAGQTLDVTITGKNTQFKKANNTSVQFGFLKSGKGINFISVISDTTLLVNVSIPQNTVSNFYTVEVSDSIDSKMVLKSGFYVNGVIMPVISELQPDSAVLSQTLNVTIHGNHTHFKNSTGAYVYFSFASGKTAVNNMSILDDSTLIVNVSIPSHVVSGYYDVTVYNDFDGAVLAEKIFYIDGVAMPYIASVSPSAAAAGQTLDITISGKNTNFSKGSSTNVFMGFLSGNPGINNIKVNSDTEIVANVSIPAATVTADYTIAVNDSLDHYLELKQAFHINGIAPPSISSISPSSAKRGQTLDVMILASHTHFTQAATTMLSFVQGGSVFLAINSFSILNDTAITANISIPPLITPGFYDVMLTNNIDGSILKSIAFDVINNTSVNEIVQHQYRIQIHPIPVSDKLYVSYSIPKISDIQMELSDIFGRTISKNVIAESQSGQYIQEFETENLPSGMYVVKMKINDDFFVQKLLKVKE